MKKSFHLFVILFLAILFACKELPRTTTEENSAVTLIESDIIFLNLDEKLSDPNNEFSGLAWYQEELFLLPQYPISNDSIKHGIFKTTKQKLSSVIDNLELKLVCEITPLELGDLEEFLSEGSGFEALAFDGTDVFFTIESMGLINTDGYVVKGVYDTLKNIIIIDQTTLVKIKSQSGIDNHSEEALGIYKGQIFTIHESNGAKVNQNPYAPLFDLELNYLKQLPISKIEYRITDITEVNDSGYFWATNYLWPGDYSEELVGPDSLVIRYGTGISHKREKTVERIVQYKIDSDKISLTNIAPIYLKLDSVASRNWEGIVHLDNKGFLIITDKYPSTLLGFIPYKH